MLLLLLPVLCYARFENEVNKENMEKGQSKYREFSENSRREKGGECWRNAVKDLEASCSGLDDSVMARLAYSFLTCHLQQHRRKVNVCAEGSDVESCTEDLSDTMFGIYTSFVMHTHNMCFYLQASMWQARMDSTVDRLQQSSENVAEGLLVTAGRTQDLLVGMDEVSSINSNILHKTNRLQEFISQIFELVERIGHIQSAFYSQFTTYEMILFYGGAVILTLITTSFAGLSQARPQIMGLTCLSFALEQATAQYGLFSLQEDEVSKYYFQKQLRRVWLMMCFGVWFRRFYWGFRETGTHAALLQQTQQNTDLLLELKSSYERSVSHTFFSDDEKCFSSTDIGIQTEGEFTPSPIKQKKYTKKKRSSIHDSCNVTVSPSRCGVSRYNLRVITPGRVAAPLTYPGFSSDEFDDDYKPQIPHCEL